MKILILFFFMSLCFSENEYSNLEKKLQVKIDRLISKVIPSEKYVAQVFVKTSKKRVKEVLEGQSQMRKSLKNESVPTLPGFSANSRGNETDNKVENYRYVERVFLDDVYASLTFDESIPDEKIERVFKMVDSLLNSATNDQYNLTIDKLPMENQKTNLFEANTIVTGLISLILLLLIALFFFLFFNKKKSPIIPTEVISNHEDRRKEQNEIINRSPYGQLSLSDESGLPPIPLSETYADKRTALLNYYMRNSETFRDYFSRLSDDLKVEVYAALRGPAFENLLETLVISVPIEGEREISLSEEKLSYLIKDFSEYIDMHSWKTNQFFGFLDQLTDEQLLTIFRNENDLVSALMLKFLTPQKAALLLDRVDSKKRLKVLEQSSRIPLLKTDELREIESMLRDKVSQLPHFSSCYSKDDIGHWSQILMATENQESILLDIEQVRPSLYPGLSKFRFNLEDIPTLPEEAVLKVIDESDNDELARAISTCSRETIEYVLACLPERRRGLLESQIISLRNLPSEVLSDSKKSLTVKFREVMA